MTPAARVEAAITLLDEIIDAAAGGGAAADTLIQRYFKTRRYAGSKDRRAVRDLVYRVIRSLGERPESGRAAMMGYARAEAPDMLALFGTDPHGPAAFVEGEPAAAPGLAPEWLTAKLAAEYGDADSLLHALAERAPLDLRVNRLKTTRGAVLPLIPGAVPTARAQDGLRLVDALNVEDLPAYNDGRVEVQDEGSQLIAAACRAQPGMTVVDLCAGAGGKTLALAADMENRGRLFACDTDRSRLSRLGPRAVRAGAANIETRLLDPGREAEALGDLLGAADVVLIDAPCSGTGTWRRNPEARWRLTPQRLARLTALQAHLADLGARLLKPGGRLVYAVCSLLPEEGRLQAEALSKTHSDLALDVGGAQTLRPDRDGTDGFFIAGYEKSC
ncbi:RsmB/NOP family class I SAM-dependent RNA methyltransferase [Sphingosinicella microcystinivorans]|uniref:16S rRNA (Cytosine967-C5)-methyltransferase n=1 Tax=Sphingosinicella microcystinivorans TaxID=335406 RepID=A0AAD1G1Z5_SPHMI|nr:RsmB/NOP family class I SAM-dependent RNA methyltransferase [Sphingosinicella microcystinivorans]RKS86455.1 16S rRNA (cytosine967-C5)-methyltransferase [Sphingosinicella microcystinivorans]BBE35442.1 rRNA cytosine-C5-methylase [Sphingosinicella microcystinivorans]